MSAFQPSTIQSIARKLIVLLTITVAGQAALATGEARPSQGGGPPPAGGYGPGYGYGPGFGAGYPPPSPPTSEADARSICVGNPVAISQYGTEAACIAAKKSGQAPFSAGGMDRCGIALDRLSTAAGGLQKYCADAALVQSRRPAYSSATPNRPTESGTVLYSNESELARARGQRNLSDATSRKFQGCVQKLQDCAQQEDDLAGELEAGGLGDDVSDMSLGTSCNEMSAAQAEDLKKEKEDDEKKLKDKQREMLEASRKASDAAAEDDKKRADALAEHERKGQQARQKEREIADNWSKQIFESNRARSELISKQTQAYRQIDQGYYQKTQAYLAARAQNRAAVRKARAACEDRAAKLMKTLESERRTAIQKFENNAGSLRALVGTVERFKSRYYQDLNNCLATDYKRTIEEANDALAIMEADFKKAQVDVMNAKMDLKRSLDVERDNLDRQLSLTQQRFETERTNLAEEQRLEEAQYQRNLAMIQQAAAQRIKNEQQEQYMIQQNITELQQKIQLNANRIAQLRIQNPGPATTRSTARRFQRAENGLDRLGTYQQAYCAAVIACPGQRPPGIDPGNCQAPTSVQPTLPPPTTNAQTGATAQPAAAEGARTPAAAAPGVAVRDGARPTRAPPTNRASAGPAR